MIYTITTFGYKYGAPKHADSRFDLVLDCRSIPNPHRNPKLWELTGFDQRVRSSVMRAGGFDMVVNAVKTLKNSAQSNILVGCVGGRHRSVAVAEALAEFLRAEGHDVDVLHTALVGKKSKKSA